MRTVRILTTALAATLSAAIFATPASAAAGIVFVSPKAGYDAMFDGEPAGNYSFTVEGSPVVAYCADQTLALDPDASFTLIPAAEAGIDGIAAAGFVASNSATIGTPLTDENFEASAVQIAVWSFTNSVVIDEISVPDAGVRARAVELVAGVPTGLAASTDAVTFELLLSATTAPGEVVFDATLADADGNPVAAAPLIFTSDGREPITATTTETGTAQVRVPAGGGTSVAMSVRYESTIAAGTVISPDNDSQPLVLADAVAVQRQASAVGVAGAADPIPATSAPAPATSAPAPAVNSGDRLADTGADGNSGLRLAAAAVLLLAALGMIVARRRA